MNTGSMPGSADEKLASLATSRRWSTRCRPLSFAFGVTALVGDHQLRQARRRRRTLYESHFIWQIRTSGGLLWGVLGFI